MKGIRSIVNTYETTFRSPMNEPIFNNLNENERTAWDIITNNDKLEDDVLNAKIYKAIYGDSTNPNGYKKFKKTFSKKLRKMVSVALSKGSDMQKDAFDLLDDYSAMMKLYYTGDREEAIHLAEALLKRSLKYQNHFLAKNICMVIVQAHGTHRPERRHKFVDQYRDIESTCSIEFESIAMFSDLVEINIKGEITKEQRRLFLCNIDNLKKKLHHDSIVYHYYYYQIQLKLSTGTIYRDYCKEAIEYFDSLWYKHTYYVSIFRNRLMDYYLRTGELALAELNIQVLLEDTKRYTTAWYKFATTYIGILLKRGNYNMALEWYTKIIRSKKYRSITKTMKNELEIIGMYVYLSHGMVDDISIRKIKYNLNADKAYLAKENIQFLVGEIAYLVLSGKVDIESKLNYLRNTIANSNKDAARCLAFCDYVEHGTPFDLLDDSNWKDEILSYEQLCVILKSKVIA